MSWSLFNHNLPTNLYNYNGYPEDPEVIDSTELWGDPGLQFSQATFQTAGLFANDTQQGKIMLNPRGYGYVVLTSDGGENWSSSVDVPRNDDANESIAMLQYVESEDDFWILINRQDNRFSYCFFSENDGGAWTSAGTDTTHSYVNCFLLDEDSGTLYVGGSNGSNVQRYLNPKVDNTKATSAAISSSKSHWRFFIVNDVAVHFYSSESASGGFTYHINPTLTPAGTSYTVAQQTNSRRSAASPTEILLVVLNTSGVITLDVITGLVPAPYPQVFVDFGEPVSGIQISYGDGLFILTAARTSDDTQLMVCTCPENDVYNGWSQASAIQLGHPQSSTDSNRRQLAHFGGGLWLIAYLTARPPPNQTQFYLVLESFLLGDRAPVASQTLLHRAIVRQTPDIYLRMDDSLGATSLVDLGSKDYTNTAEGSLTFGQAGLVADGGDACLIDSATDTGVLFQSVPTPDNHAHFFVLKHDGTVSVRILGCSGDYSDTDEVGYYYFLAANNKLGVAVYSGGWEYHYSTASLTADTRYLCAVSVASSGKVTFYVGYAWDSAIDDVPYETLSATVMSLGGGWTGAETLSQSADGVTVDYYALIPLSTFNYKLLVEADGGTYTGPSVVTGSPEGVVFLVHADEAALNPVFVNSQQVYEAINSAPSSSAQIHNAYSKNAVTTDGKFGAGALSNRQSTQNFVTSPWYSSYWNEGNLTQIGVQDFTYDVQVKADWDSGLCYPACSNGLYRRSTRYYRFGGITIKLSKATATTGNISVLVGCSLEQALLGSRDSLELHYVNVPGYIDGNYNHVAVCRASGTWFVFLNGTLAVVTSVVRRNEVNELTIPILAGGQWLLGGYYKVPLPGQPLSTPTFYCPPSKFDEARLIIGRAEFVEPFVPPTAPYDYG